MKLVAASFAWQFRGAWRSRFVVGALMVLLLPVAFIPLLGYAIEATRAAVSEGAQAPPEWRPTPRMIADGFWTAILLLLLSVPFILALNPLADAIESAHLWHVSDQPLSHAYAHMAATLVLALPWGLLLLLLMPHAASRFAGSGRPRDLFDLAASLRGVKRDFPTWNLVAAAMVTAWALGVACVGLLFVGIVPGVFYAILVSAHACAALRSPTSASSPNPSPR